jgi:ATP-dependent helicase/DNAse subunit B
LRARYSRWERKWKAADGLVGAGSMERDILAARCITARPYSASALQDFAACPYRFYLRGILGLREKETKTGIEQMDPLTRGALFHEAQYRFFQTVIGSEPATLDAALGIADTALDDMEAKYREELAPAIPRVWKTEIEDLRNDLRAWARHWWSERAEWQPIHSELAFGLSELSGRDPHSVTQHVELAGNIRVRGSIDLIEKHRRRNSLRITDHKTGKAPQQEPACVGGGAVLQPALYGLVAEAMLGVAVETGRLFFCTQRGGFRTVDIPLNGPTRMRIGRVLGLIDDAIGKGFLPPAPAREACTLCDYRAVCGPYEEMRSQRKEPRDVLEPLYEIRRMP